MELQNGNSDVMFNSFEGLEEVPYKILQWLVTNQSDEANWLWKCLKYNGKDCLSQPDVEIEERINLIKSQIDKSTSEYDITMMKERLSKLSGGVAIIKVGASTETELREIKDRVDDALSATKSAVQEGIVVGGGCALVHAKKCLKSLDLKGDEKLGAQIIESALEAPLRCIASNAGVEGATVLEAVMHHKDESYGFDAKEYVFGNLWEKGIIDPVKVTRCALQNAVSIAGLILTTEAVIVDTEDMTTKLAAGSGPQGTRGPVPGMF